VGAAEPAVAVYRNEVWINTNLGLNIGINLADIAAVAYVLSTNADGNNIVGSRNIIAGSTANSNVVGAGSVAKERRITDGCVSVAGCVSNKRSNSVACILVSVSAVLQPKCTRGGVVVARDISRERMRPVGRIVKSRRVILQRRSTGSRISETCVVSDKRTTTNGRFFEGSSITKKGTMPQGRIITGNGIF